MWYLAPCWNPNLRMCAQVRGVIRNFIWSGKDAPARAKVKWDTLVLPTPQGGLGIIDLKTRSEALLAKLLVRGLASGGEPWKELVRHKADQIRLPVHGKKPQHPRHQLAFRRSQAQEDPLLNVEKYSRSLVKREAGTHQSGSNQHG